MYRHYYDDNGNILRVAQHDTIFILSEDGNWVDLEILHKPSKYYYDTANNQMVAKPEATDQQITQVKTDWVSQRRRWYGTSEQQMNWLYDDIKAGKFGEDAKTGKWYLHIKAVKEQYPKD